MINPANRALPPADTEEIRNKILLKVKAELLKRKEKGYNIDLSIIDEEIDKFLKDCNVG